MVVKGDSTKQAAGTQATAAFWVQIAVERVHRGDKGVWGAVVLWRWHAVAFEPTQLRVQAGSKLPGVLVRPSGCVAADYRYIPLWVRG